MLTAALGFELRPDKDVAFNMHKAINDLHLDRHLEVIGKIGEVFESVTYRSILCFKPSLYNPYNPPSSDGRKGISNRGFIGQYVRRLEGCIL